MSQAKAALSAGEKTFLLLLSQGKCANPDCHELLIVDRDGTPIVNFEYAHIRDELAPADRNGDIGWRYWPAEDLSPVARNQSDNLILLCSPCHKLIDKISPKEFPVGLLRHWKEQSQDGDALGQGSKASIDELNESLASLLQRADLRLRMPRAKFGDLLSFESDLIPFVRQERYTSELRTFLYSAPTFSWQMVIGEAGTGKSRLLFELCKQEASLGWHAGFLPEARQDALIGYVPLRPTLVVIDYAASRADLLGAALADLSERSVEFTHQVRIAIVERTDSDDWFSKAARTSRHHESIQILSHQHSLPLVVSGMSRSDLADVVRAASTVLDELHPKDFDVTELVDRALAIDPKARPLFALVAAIESHGDLKGHLSRDSMLRALGNRARGRLAERVSNPGDTERAMSLMYMATVAGGFGISDIRRMSEGIVRMSTLPPSIDFLPSHILEEALRGMRPDIVGEICVLDLFDQESAVVTARAQDICEAVWTKFCERYAAFVGRAARDHPYHSGLVELVNVEVSTDSRSETRRVWYAMVAETMAELVHYDNPNVERLLRLSNDRTDWNDRIDVEHALAIGFRHANLLLFDRQLGGANNCYTHILSLADKDWEICASCLTNRALTWLHVGETDRALDDMERVIDSSWSDEGRACCLNNRADLRRDSGDLKGSIEDRTAVLSLQETSFNRRYIALVRRAAAFRDLRMHAECYSDIEAILGTPDIVDEQKMDARFARAEWLIEDGFRDRAVSDLSIISVSDRNFPGLAERATDILNQLFYE